MYVFLIFVQGDRKDQLRRGKLQEPGELKRSHRGVDSVARRKAETKRLKLMKAMK